MYALPTYDDEFRFDDRAGFGAFAGGAATHLQRYQAAIAAGNTALAQTLEQQAQYHTTQNIPDRAAWQQIYAAIEASKAKPVAPVVAPGGVSPGPTGVPMIDILPVPPVSAQTTVGPPVSDTVAQGTPTPPVVITGTGDGGVVSAPAPSGGVAGFLTSPVALVVMAAVGLFALTRSRGTRRL